MNNTKLYGRFIQKKTTLKSDNTRELYIIEIDELQKKKQDTSSTHLVSFYSITFLSIP